MAQMNYSTAEGAYQRTQLLCCLEAILDSGVTPTVTTRLMNKSLDRIAYQSLHVENAF